MGSILDKIFNDWINGAVDFFLKLIAEVAGISIYVLELDFVKEAIIYTQAIALAWVIVLIGFQAIYVYILRMNGDINNPTDLIKGGISSVVIISTVPWIVQYVFKFGTSLAIDMSKLPGSEWKTSQNELKNVMDTIVKSQTVIPLFVLLSIFVAIIAVIVVIIQTSIRAAELAYAAVAGPLLATGLVSNGSGMYSSWWKDIVALSLAQGSQLFMLKLSFEALKTMVYEDFPIMSLFLFLGIIWVAIKVPQTIKNWVYSTGTGRMATGAAQQAGQMALTRKVMMKKG